MADVYLHPHLDPQGHRRGGKLPQVLVERRSRQATSFETVTLESFDSIFARTYLVSQNVLCMISPRWKIIRTNTAFHGILCHLSMSGIGGFGKLWSLAFSRSPRRPRSFRLVA